MKHLLHLIISSVCAVSLLTGCQGEDGEPGPAGPNLTGNLYGFVNPVDETGNPIAKSGVTVVLEGVSPALTATSDANGRFEFQNLRAGTYNLAYTRTDVSSFRRLGVGHVGGDQPSFVFTTSLTQPSSTRVSNIAVAPNQANGAVTLQFSLSNNNLPAGAVYRYLVYVGSSPGVSAADGLWYGNLTYGTQIPGSASVVLNRAGLNALGFASNTAVYARVYGMPVFQLSYADPNTGRPVITGLSAAPSAAVGFMVP